MRATVAATGSTNVELDTVVAAGSRGAGAATTSLHCQWRANCLHGQACVCQKKRTESGSWTYVSNSHRLAVVDGTVELFNGDTSVLGGVHLDETKATRLACMGQRES